MTTTTKSIAQQPSSPQSRKSGLLRPDQYDAGFSVDLDDHVIILRRFRGIIGVYGTNTPMATIHHDIDQTLEMEKAVAVERIRDEAREVQAEIRRHRRMAGEVA